MLNVFLQFFYISHCKRTNAIRTIPPDKPVRENTQHRCAIKWKSQAPREGVEYKEGLQQDQSYIPVRMSEGDASKATHPLHMR